MIQTAPIMIRQAAKIPPIPFAMISSDIMKFSIIMILSFLYIHLFLSFMAPLQESGHQVDHNAACDHRCDLPGHIGPGCMHQDDIARLLLSCQLLDHS